MARPPAPRFGIHRHAAALGEVKTIESDWTARFGTSSHVVARIAQTGLRTFRATRNKTPADIVFESLDKLFDGGGPDPRLVDLIILGHTLASSVCLPPDDIVQAISDRYGTTSNGFSVNQLQCSTPSFVLDLIERILTCDPQVATVLFIANDICIDDESRCSVGSLFLSDGAVSVLFSRDAPGPRHVASSILVDSQYYDYETRDLSPNALAQYEFTSIALNAACFGDAIRKSGWSSDDIDWYIPFSGHPRLWRNVCTKTGIPDDRILFPNLKDVGHLFSGDLIHNLMTAIEIGAVETGNKVACATLGEGRTFGCSLFEI